MALRDKLIATFTKVKSSRMSHRASYDDRALLGKVGSCVLTDDERDEIIDRWGQIGAALKEGYPGFIVYKGFRGFSSDFVPSAFYYPYVVRTLNPGRYYRAFENKCLTSTLIPDVKQPVTVARLVRGNLILSGGGHRVESLEKIIDRNDKAIIVKQAIDSCCGRNIDVLYPGEGRGRRVVDILRQAPSDMIVQELVGQSRSTSVFNPSSLNTFRITTLYINGEISVCSRAIKMGKPGNVVDNIGGDGGGIIVGVSSEGILDEIGFGSTGVRHAAHGAVRFGGMSIDNFSKVIDLALSAHSQLPYCGVVGWDIALDQNDEAVLIEANLWWPGTLLEQLCSGPMFGERTEEVIKYVESNGMEL